MKKRINKVIIKKFNIIKTPEEEVDAYISLLNSIDKINNPSIIKLYDMYRNDTYLCIVTEYGEGGDLFTKVKSHGFKYNEQQVGEIILRLLGILRDIE